MGSLWRAWRLAPGWKSQGRDIQWAEAIGFELLTICVFALANEGDHVLVHGDNRGVVEGWWKRCSTNRPTNHIFRRILQRSEDCNKTVHTRYVPSVQNPADAPSRASIPPAPSCSTLSPSLARLGISSPMSDPRELAKKTAVRHLTRARNIDDDPTDAEQRAPKQRKVSKARPRHLPIPPASTPTTRGPAPYQPHLTPTPSSLRPHCLAKDQLRRWIPASKPLQPASGDGPAEAERERVKDMMVHTWEEDTRVAYGAGLLMWHCFCDKKGVPEESRAPAAQPLLSAFVAHLATAYSGRTIAGYLNGVCAWHILHGLQCALEKKEMDTMLRVADKLTRASSKKKKSQPYTPEFIAMVRAHLDLEKPLDLRCTRASPHVFMPRQGWVSSRRGPW